MTDKDLIAEQRREFEAWAKANGLAGELDVMTWEWKAWQAAKESDRQRIEGLEKRLAEQQNKFEEKLLNVESHHFYRGMEAGRKGVQEVGIGENSPNFLEEWIGHKPFARIQFFYDNGDMSVGIFPVSGWEISPDQSGTGLEELTKREALARQQGFEEAKSALGLFTHDDVHELQNLAREEGKQAGRDELQKEYSEMEPTYKINGEPLIPRPSAPIVKEQP